MKNLLITILLVFAFTQVAISQESSNAINWEDIEVVYELENVENYTKGERLTETLKTSLNFGTKSKFERVCLKKLKQQAAEKGYHVVYVDQEASSNKRFNKRGIEITLVGRGYKN